MKLAVIPGDGIGIEVTEQALRVLDAVHPGVDATHYDLGAARWHRTGEVLPDSVLEETPRRTTRSCSVRSATRACPSGVLERGLLLKLRFALDHHVNLRPARLYPGVATPLAGDPAIDFVVVREGTEGPYTGNGGVLRKGTPHEIATEVSVNTAFGVERVVRDAFGRAQARPRKHLTLVHKNNVLINAGDLWFRTVNAVAPEFPDVTVAYNHVDAATIYLVTDPGRYDVIVTDNLFGDIITDLAAAIAGGIGLAASGNLDVSPAPIRRCSNRCTARRRTSPDRTRPTRPRRCCRSSMLLEHVGETDAAQRVEAAVAADLVGPRPAQPRAAPRDRRAARESGAELSGSGGTRP